MHAMYRGKRHMNGVIRGLGGYATRLAECARKREHLEVKR